MKDILARASRRALRPYSGPGVLLGFDYDGTLAPIVAEPGRAVMRPATRGLLRRLARLCPCVVISGRARADVLSLLRGSGVRRVIGNHGLEPASARPGARARVRRWRAALERRLSGQHGVAIEDKGLSLSVHYRGARRKRQARAAILAAASGLRGARLLGGKQVVNVLPRGAGHKGAALERERARRGCRAAIFIGDDETDEDVFALGRTRRLLAVRVGRRRASAAAYFVRSQAQVDELLRVLLLLARARSHV